jgi:hypothetical protein
MVIGVVQLEHVSLELQNVDNLTKALGQGKFEKFRIKLGVINFESKRSVKN